MAWDISVISRAMAQSVAEDEVLRLVGGTVLPAGADGVHERRELGGDRTVFHGEVVSAELFRQGVRVGALHVGAREVEQAVVGGAPVDHVALWALRTGAARLLLLEAGLLLVVLVQVLPLELHPRHANGRVRRQQKRGLVVVPDVHGPYLAAPVRAQQLHGVVGGPGVPQPNVRTAAGPPVRKSPRMAVAKTMKARSGWDGLRTLLIHRISAPCA